MRMTAIVLALLFTITAVHAQTDDEIEKAFKVCDKNRIKDLTKTDTVRYNDGFESCTLVAETYTKVMERRFLDMKTRAEARQKRAAELAKQNNDHAPQSEEDVVADTVKKLNQKK